jgi:dTDP-4-dehydrorhamnose 3,5-epimerase-like enzyme
MSDKDIGLPDQVIVPLESSFTDDRGVIQNLLERDTSSTVIIASKRGAVRANHYHKTER